MGQFIIDIDIDILMHFLSKSQWDFTGGIEKDYPKNLCGSQNDT